VNFDDVTSSPALPGRFSEECAGELSDFVDADAPGLPSLALPQALLVALA
jgi:hypothetical protein